MPTLTIRLFREPELGPPRVTVSLRSEEDALPHEHEQHKALVERLLGASLAEAKAGGTEVEREKGKAVALG